MAGDFLGAGCGRGVVVLGRGGGEGEALEEGAVHCFFGGGEEGGWEEGTGDFVDAVAEGDVGCCCEERVVGEGGGVEEEGVAA